MNRSPILPLVLGLVATVAHGQQQARIVKYHANDIVSVHAKMRYTTLIQLPSTEKDSGSRHGRQGFLDHRRRGQLLLSASAKEGIHSNLNLITDKGTVYSFTLDDVESGDPDLKVVIEPSDPSTLAAANGVTRLVPAGEVDAARAQAQIAQTRAATAVEEFRAGVSHSGVEVRLQLSQRIAFRRVRNLPRRPLHLHQVLGCREVRHLRGKDGKPDLITFQLKDGTYILPKIVDKGYLEIGKHRLTFERKGQ